MYHYTSDICWDAMHLRGQEGLLPFRPLIQREYALTLPRQALRSTLFGLPTEIPPSWRTYQNKKRQNVFEILLRQSALRGDDMAGFCEISDSELNLVLLKATLLPSDQPHIIDFNHISQAFNHIDQNTSPSQRTEHLIAAATAYWNSRIPLTNYQHNYTLPEILLHNPIPLERIEIVWEKTLPQALQDIFQQQSHSQNSL